MKDDCSKYTEKLSAYMDGLLPPDEMAGVAAHLDTCESCSLLLEKMRRVDEMAEHVMPEFDEALMAQLADRIAKGIDEPGQPGDEAEPAAVTEKRLDQRGEVPDGDRHVGDPGPPELP